MATPPLGFTEHINFGNVARGQPASGEGGAQIRFNGQALVQIEGDFDNVFSVSGIEGLRLEFDPDAPPGSGRSWQTVFTADGSGPVKAGGAQALGVTILFACPLAPQRSSYEAVALVLPAGETTPLFEISLAGTVDFSGRISIDPISSPALENGMLPGQTADLSVDINSTALVDVPGTLSRIADGQPFIAPDIQVVAPARGRAQVSIPVTCAAGTQPGNYDGVKFQFRTSNPDWGSLANVTLRVLSGRSVAVSASLTQNLRLTGGSATAGALTAYDSGGQSLITYRVDGSPDGVTVVIGPPHTVAGGQFPNQSRIIEADISITVSPAVPLGHLDGSIVVGWDVPADGSHNELSGSIRFDVTVLPATVAGPFCVFGDPPGSPTVGVNAWGLKSGYPRKSQLSWSASGSVNGVTGQIPIANVIPAALAKWSAAAPTLVFTQVPSGGDIVFSAANLGAAGALGSTTADGSGTTFNNNSAVVFVQQAPGTISLLAVATHEIGHALGLLHNDNPASVMFPQNPANETLSPEDVGAIRALYSWAPQSAAPGIGTDAGPALCSCGGVLAMAWRGIGDDLNIWFAVSTDGVSWTPQQTVPGAASADGPTLVWDGSLLWMAWRGIGNDQGLYFATWDLTSQWSGVQPIGGSGSSVGPSIAVIAGVPTMVWKGIGDDSGIYFSTFSGGSWAGQQNIGGVGTSDRPAISTDPVTGIPRMVWKGIEGDHALYTSTQRGFFWEPQEMVSWIVAGNGASGTVGIGRPGSQFGPGITTSGGRLSMAWRGVGSDQNIWFTQAAPDAGVGGNQITEWSTQANVGGYATSSRPAVAAFGGKTFLAWKGAGFDNRIFTTSV